jgi:hypothetical protein
MKSRKKTRNKTPKSVKSEYIINKIPTKIESVKLTKNVTQYKVKSLDFEPLIFSVDTRKNEILNNDNVTIGSIKKSCKKASVTKKGIILPVEKLSSVKKEVNQLVKQERIINSKYIAYSLIALSTCVGISYGIPHIIHAANNFYHQGALDEIARADAHQKIKYADAIGDIAKTIRNISITIPMTIIATASGTMAVLGVAAAVFVGVN